MKKKIMVFAIALALTVGASVTNNADNTEYAKHTIHPTPTTLSYNFFV